jgi:hypothetical protein
MIDRQRLDRGYGCHEEDHRGQYYPDDAKYRELPAGVRAGRLDFWRGTVPFLGLRLP